MLYTCTYLILFIRSAHINIYGVYIGTLYTRVQPITRTTSIQTLNFYLESRFSSVYKTHAAKAPVHPYLVPNYH